LRTPSFLWSCLGMTQLPMNDGRSKKPTSLSARSRPLIGGGKRTVRRRFTRLALPSGAEIGGVFPDRQFASGVPESLSGSCHAPPVAVSLRGLGLQDMPVNDPTLLPSNEIMVGVLFPLVRLPSDVKRPFRIARKLLRKGSQNVTTAPVLLFDYPANSVVFFRYFHIIIVTV